MSDITPQMSEQLLSKCSSCTKLIEKHENHMECVTCLKWFHADISCIKASNLNDRKIDSCQFCLKNYLPFQTLSNDEFESIDNNTLSERDMDRLNQLKLNPFYLNKDIAMCESNVNLDNVLDTNRLKCDYFIPEHFKKHTSVTKSGQLNNFSVLCLNIRSIVNKFDMLN